jgi:hypothetical protein
MRNTFASALLLIALPACRGKAPESAPAPALDPVAPFVITGESAQPAPGKDPRGYLRCAISGKFTGAAYVRGPQLELVVTGGAIAVTRKEDKQGGDDLHVQFMLGRSRPVSGMMPQAMSETVVVRLGPTVDTSAALLTTWQAQDTMHLLLPWDRGSAARRIFASIGYRARALDGTTSDCEMTIPGDTLRFVESAKR